MPPWNLDETREHISRLFGRKQFELAAPSIRSVDDRRTYARIHFQAARATIEACVSAELQEASLLEVTLGVDREGWIKFNVFTSATKPRALSATSVTAQLTQHPERAKLGALLETLAIGGEFKHLSALANRAKHRSIVFSSLNEDFTGEREAKHAVTFPPSNKND